MWTPVGGGIEGRGPQSSEGSGQEKEALEGMRN